MKSLAVFASIASAIVIGSATSASADVINYAFTVDDCSGTCGTGPYGNVRVSDIATGEVQVTVTFNPVLKNFARTGAGGDESLLFDLSGTPTITSFTDVSSNVPITLASSTAGSIMADGTGTWQYAVGCPTCGGGQSAPVLDAPITFDISAVGLSTASFVQNGNLLFFAADVGGTNGNTGDVGAPSRTTSVPEPASLAIFGSALLGLGAAVRRRRKDRV